MPTSGTTDYSLTARELITDAAQDAAIIGIGESLTDEEMTACVRRLNNMLKSWQMQGVLWKQETITQTITADTATISLPAYVRGVNAARYVDSATNERQMVRWERDEYYRIPNKAASGVSTAFYVNRAEDGLVLHVWPVPTANNSIQLDIDRAMDTVTDASETIDVPQELMETVMKNLAVRISSVFGAQLSQETVTNAALLERLMIDSYRPASYFMEAC